MVAEITKNHLFWSFLLFDATPRNPYWYPHEPILPETRVPGLHFCPLIVCFSQIFVVNAERRIICAVECGTAVQGHPRALIYVLIESAY